VPCSKAREIMSKKTEVLISSKQYYNLMSARLGHQRKLEDTAVVFARS
jgi:hypothetical protein